MLVCELCQRTEEEVEIGDWKGVVCCWECALKESELVAWRDRVNKQLGLYIPPFFSIPMPLTIDGEGPARPEETVKVIYEVWDQANCTVSFHETEKAAVEDAVRLNNLYKEKEDD